MAVVQYTAIVNQIRGKLNGSVFNKGKTSYTLQRKQQGSRRSTQLQLKRRSNFSSVQRRWKEISAVERSNAQLSAQSNPSVDRFGNEVVLSGYNHWVKNNLIRVLVGESILNNMIVTPSPGIDYILQSSVLGFSLAPNGGVLVNAGFSGMMNSAQNALFYFVMYISYPMSTGITSYSGRWFFVGYHRAEYRSIPVGGFEINIQPTEAIDYPISDIEGKVLVRVDVWQPSRGALVNSQIVEGEF